MEFALISKNGQILPRAAAAISVFNIEYAYGFGVYENIRVQNSRAFFLEDHLNRLAASAERLGLGHPIGAEKISEYVGALVVALAENSAYNLKILLIGGKTPEQAQIFILPLAPLFPDKKLYREGVRAMTVAHERIFPEAKTLNMLPSYLYYNKAKEAGCYEVLYVDQEGNIREGSRTNFFVLDGRTIISPPKSTILAGVMRRHVLLAAGKGGFAVREQPIPLGSIKKYTGAFLTSTSSKIMPLNQIDDQRLPVPAACAELIKLFANYLADYVAGSK